MQLSATNINHNAIFVCENETTSKTKCLFLFKCLLLTLTLFPLSLKKQGLQNNIHIYGNKNLNVYLTNTFRCIFNKSF